MLANQKSGGLEIGEKQSKQLFLLTLAQIVQGFKHMWMLLQPHFAAQFTYEIKINRRIPMFAVNGFCKINKITDILLCNHLFIYSIHITFKPAQPMPMDRACCEQVSQLFLSRNPPLSIHSLYFVIISSFHVI